MSNRIGEKFQITTFGSSHGKAVGAVVDGCPANLELDVSDIQNELDRRKPGTSKVTTSRKEDDEVKILSGVFNGKTDGTPIAAVVFNKNQHSKDYSMFEHTPRPSHGDFAWMSKYGNYDYRGGGRGSGRVTIGHVIGGAVAKKLLKIHGIEIISHVVQIGNIKSEVTDFAHTHVKSEITDFAHNHDDRYYTKTEVDSLIYGLNNKLKLNVDKNIIQTGDTIDLRAFVMEDGMPQQGKVVNFYINEEEEEAE